MSYIRETNPREIRRSFGLALDEIKLKRSIDNLLSLLSGLDDSTRVLVLRKEMDNKKNQLRSVQRLRQ